MKKHGYLGLFALVVLACVLLVVSCRPEAPPDEARTIPITPTEELNLTGIPPEEVDIDAYRLTVDGLVDNPLSLTYDEIMAYPAVTEVVLLICPGVFNDDAEWTGVPLWAILQDAGVSPEATEVSLRAMPVPLAGSYTNVESKPYTVNLPLEEVMGNDSIFLAHTVNGEVLPLEHGFPLRLVAKDRFGYDWVKWVEGITVE